MAQQPERVTITEKNSGNLDNLKQEFAQAAGSKFGSGCAWPVKDKDMIKIVKTGNARNPLTAGRMPLLTIDVLEHAYYLDCQNRRTDYVTTISDRLINCGFALENWNR